MIKRLFLLTALACVVNLSTDQVLFADEADEDVDDDNVHRCINSRTLKRTEVVDDHHILFFMSGNTVYVNRLPRACIGLSREGRFSYTTSSRSLCNFDSIRVLSDVGSSLHQGRSCRLGDFVLTSIEAVEDARKRALEPPPIKAPSGAEVEDVVNDAEN